MHPPKTQHDLNSCRLFTTSSSSAHGPVFAIASANGYP